MGKSETWADRVEKLIEQYGGREALAVALGVSYYTVARWATGAHEPSRIAQTLLEKLEKKEAKK